MKFRTEYKAVASDVSLDPCRPAVLLGSCFSDYIGRRLNDALWPALVNPCGTMFNPLSIAAVVEMALGVREPVFACRDGIWHSWDFSTEFSSPDREECVRMCHEALADLSEWLRNASLLVVTFGTSVVYSLESDPDRVVANCHKYPSSFFRKEMLPVEKICEVWEHIVRLLRDVNPGLEIIFTVSPVRHVADGFVTNSRSKARLLLACEALSDKLPHVDYFPAYEIVCDDLRDYRFYGDDLVHPSPMAVDYIWEKFTETYLTPASLGRVREGEKLKRRISHRHIHPGTPAADTFDESTRVMTTLFREGYNVNGCKRIQNTIANMLKTVK